MNPFRSITPALLLMSAIGTGCPIVSDVDQDEPDDVDQTDEEATPEAPAAELALNMGWAYYGASEGQTLQMPFTVANLSDRDVTFDTQVSTNNGDFALVSDPSRTLTPGSDAIVLVRFQAPQDVTSVNGLVNQNASVSITSDAGETHEGWISVDVWDADGYGMQELYVWASELWMWTEVGNTQTVTLQVQGGAPETSYTTSFASDLDSGFAVIVGGAQEIQFGDTALIVVEFTAPESVEEGYDRFWNILTVETESGESHEVMITAEVSDPDWIPPSE